VLALVLMLGGAAITALIAITAGGRETFLAAIVLTIVQLAVALGLRMNVTGARVAAIGVLLVQLLVLLLIAYVFLVLVALPMEGGGPFTGHDFNPVWFAGIVAAIVVSIAVYLLAARSAWRSKSTVSVAQ